MFPYEAHDARADDLLGPAIEYLFSIGPEEFPLSDDDLANLDGEESCDD